MSNVLKPFGSIESAVRALLVRDLPGLKELAPSAALKLIGGDYGYAPSKPFYIRLDKIDGRMTRLEGDFVLDIEVFAKQYLAAESRSLDIEALVLGYPHVVEAGGRTVVFDKVSQNRVPDDLPWEDTGVARIGATYVFTVRRH